MSISELQIKLNIQQIRNAGTFAEVYLADTVDISGRQKTAAIKILKEKWNDNLEILQRFQDEANLLQNLSHPNILQVEGLIEIEKRAGILMEFIDGIDLKQVLKSLREPLPQAVGFEIAAKIADALHNAYAVAPPNHDTPLRVIHRDIKPSNVMVSATGDVKILDFGASFFLSADRNASTQMFQFGSQKYMPPERKQGERGSHKADVYSLGITLIEMLSSQKVNVLPTEKNEHDRIIKAHVAAIPIKLPSPVWEERARETIMRMCAYEKKFRITADQAKGMLIPFSQSSEGPNLAEFSKSHIAPLARRAFSNNTGALSGIVIDTRPLQAQSKNKARNPHKGDSATFPLPNIELELRNHNNDTLELDPATEELAPKAAPSPPRPATASASSPLPLSENRGFHSIAFLSGIASSTLLTMIVLTLLNASFKHFAAASTQEPPSLEAIPEAPPTEQATTQATTQENPTEATESLVEIEQDSNLRYVRLQSLDGSNVFGTSNSSPQKSAQIPNGQYNLRYKSRPNAGIPVDKTLTIQIDGDIQIHCGMDKDKIGCVDGAGDSISD